SSLVLRDLKDPNGFPECSVRKPGAAAPENDHPMDQVGQGFGQANPNAPASLSRFAFLIGRWRCKARVRLANGEWQTLHATWLGRFVLDGYAIADEYFDDQSIAY